MREIKFRFWNGQAKKYHLDQRQVLACLTNQIIYGYDYTFEGCSFEQFTGLRDKNGREIYEGDIVSTEARNRGKGIEVRFHNSSWHGFYRELRFVLTEGELLEEYTVIGNIHENPELLEDNP